MEKLVAPELLRLGSLVVHGYGAMIALGIAISFPVVLHFAARFGLTRLNDRILTVFFVTTVSAYLGGKLGFVLGDPHATQFILERGGLHRLAQEGFVFQAAMIVTIPALLLTLRQLRLPVLASLDRIILAAPILHGFGRVGCFLAGCCYGAFTDGPFGVEFPPPCPVAGAAVHPTQLYEAIGELVIFGILVLRTRRPHHVGAILGTWIVAYGILRFLTESVRGDGNPVWIGGSSSGPGEAASGLTHGHVYALLFLVVGGLLLVAIRRLPTISPRPGIQSGPDQDRRAADRSVQVGRHSKQRRGVEEKAKE